jgi:hypothetical protein
MRAGIGNGQGENPCLFTEIYSQSTQTGHHIQTVSEPFNQLLSRRESPDLVQISVEVLEDDLTNNTSNR